ncbi:MAG: ABC transporter ATP-binding protein, partial [Anaerolineales bacterium]|nr:ABC transporter ATP-binding protein [Anaerolineales bacterium]
MTSIVEIEGLTKEYSSVTALKDLHLTVQEGSVFGFIGPNGAGKTTTMRILTTLLKPTSGRAYIGGYSVTEQPQEVRRIIGYMPDFFGVYDDMKVWEYLDFFAACYDVPVNQRRGMIGDLLALVDLSHKRDEYVESLSRGMKQRLCLARTLAHDPQVLILDEPASGLDPRARVEMRELLRELQNMGKTIFFSSHILSEVADICTSIGIMEAGQMVAYGNLEEMRRQLQVHQLIHVRVLGDTTPLKE